MPGKLSLKMFLIVVSFAAADSMACPVVDSQGVAVSMLDDPFFQLISRETPCPHDVSSLHGLIDAAGYERTKTMVANRGFHNPGAGSFSIFEVVTGVGIEPGDFTFGHFTRADGRRLILDQEPRRGALLVELIAWDGAKEAFNFYELIGLGGTSQWFYRGDSFDIAADVKDLHLKDDAPIFGNRLRCSGCHVGGGPIMKELEAPHNDWWTEVRPLSFGFRVPSGALDDIVATLSDAAKLGEAVKVGTGKLLSGRFFDKAGESSLKILLRPLFCAQEINLTSTSEALGGANFEVSSSFWIDPLLTEPVTLSIDPVAYEEVLINLRSKFPETDRRDADHGFLAPVRSFGDTRWVEELISRGFVSKEFVRDVLAVDFRSPLFSESRCSLLRSLPDSSAGDWQASFKHNLAQRNDPAAAMLLANLSQDDSTEHVANAKAFLASCAASLGGESGLTSQVQMLSQRRAEVFASAISRNPRGQIMEPGFRVVFPNLGQPWPPFTRSFNEHCLAHP